MPTVCHRASQPDKTSAGGKEGDANRKSQSWRWTCHGGELSVPVLYLKCSECSVAGIIGLHVEESKDITPKVVQAGAAERRTSRTWGA